MTSKSTTTHGHASHTAAATASANEEESAAPAKASAKGKSKAAPAPVSPPVGPTVEAITAMIDQLDEMASQFGTNATPLTIAERRRLLKIRPGGEPHAATVMNLADRYGLTIPGESAANVQAHVKVTQDLAPLITRLEATLGLATDVSLGSQSCIWRSATKAYSMLVRLVPDYPALQRELTPMASFLATKYKDAPTSLRPQEKKTLSRSRSAKKVAAEAAATISEPAPTTEATAAQTAAAPPPAASASSVVAKTAN